MRVNVFCLVVTFLISWAIQLFMSSQALAQVKVPALLQSREEELSTIISPKNRLDTEQSFILPPIPTACNQSYFAPLGYGGDEGGGGVNFQFDPPPPASGPDAFYPAYYNQNGYSSVVNDLTVPPNSDDCPIAVGYAQWNYVPPQGEPTIYFLGMRWHPVSPGQNSFVPQLLWTGRENLNEQQTTIHSRRNIPWFISQDSNQIFGTHQYRRFSHNTQQKQAYTWISNPETFQHLGDFGSYDPTINCSYDSLAYAGTETAPQQIAIGYGSYNAHFSDNTCIFGSSSKTMKIQNGLLSEIIDSASYKSEAVAISANGNQIIVNRYEVGSTKLPKAYLIQPNLDPTPMATLEGGNSTKATTINPAGTIIGGYANRSSSASDIEAVLWSPDGQVLHQLGRGEGTSPSKWTPGCVTGSKVTDISANGTKAIGIVTLSTQSNCYPNHPCINDSGGEAFIWDTQNGMQKLSSYLTNKGVQLDGWTLCDVRTISQDGKTFGGRAVNINQPNQFQAFIAHIGTYHKKLPRIPYNSVYPTNVPLP